MLHEATKSFATLSPAKAKAAALAIFDNAQTDPSADWRGVAYALHAAYAPRPKLTTDPFGWADYKVAARTYEKAVAIFTFADGVEIRHGILRTPGKPWAIARHVGAIVDRYRTRARKRLGFQNTDFAPYANGLSALMEGFVDYDRHVAVPDFVSARMVDGSGGWDVAMLNEQTASRRMGRMTVPADYRAVLDPGVPCPIRQEFARIAREECAAVHDAKVAAAEIARRAWTIASPADPLRSMWIEHAYDAFETYDADAFMAALAAREPEPVAEPVAKPARKAKETATAAIPAPVVPEPVLPQNAPGEILAVAVTPRAHIRLACLNGATRSPRDGDGMKRATFVVTPESAAMAAAIKGVEMVGWQ